MTTFDERERAQENAYQHEQELVFRCRNRRNKLFGLWVAKEHLGLNPHAAADYAKAVVLADFDAPGSAAMLAKVRADLAQAGRAVPDEIISATLQRLEIEARRQVMEE